MTPVSKGALAPLHRARRLLLVLSVLCALGWSWPPDSTEIVREQGPSFSAESFNAPGAELQAVTTGTLKGWFRIWQHYTPPLTWDWDDFWTDMGFRCTADSFSVYFPNSSTALMNYYAWRGNVDGRSYPNEDRSTMVVVPLATFRDTIIPPWGAGQFGKPQWDGDTLPALPGVAWHAFMPSITADRCTLSMWGYSAGPCYVGHLTLRTPVRITPDSNRVLYGFWHTLTHP